MSGVLVNGLIPQEWEVHVLPRVPAAKAGVRGSGLRPVENHPSCVSRNVADKGASPNLQGLLCTEALERLPGGRAVISSWCGCPLIQFPHHASLLSARRLGCHVSGLSDGEWRPLTAGRSSGRAQTTGGSRPACYGLNPRQRGGDRRYSRARRHRSPC